MGTVGLIAYGSLFPFRFSLGNGDTVGAALAALAFRPASRGDVVANLILYLPLGASLAIWARTRTLPTLGIAALYSFALSCAIEVLQFFEVMRISSLTDVALNVAGGVAGAAAAIALIRHLPRLRAWGFDPASSDRLAVLVFGCWAAFRLAPFVPVIDLQKYKNAIRPLVVDPALPLSSVLVHAIAWSTAAYALRSLHGFTTSRLAFLAAAGVVLFGRIVIVGKSLAAAEIAGLLLALLVAEAMRRAASHKQAAVLLGSVCLVLLVQGLEPFAWSYRAQEFSWIPFRNSLGGNWEFGYSVLFEKLFWYCAAIWLFVRAGTAVAVAAGSTAMLLLLIEIAQKWIPGRSPELTDPLLAVAVGLGVQLFGLSSDATALGRRRQQPDVSTAADRRQPRA